MPQVVTEMAEGVIQTGNGFIAAGPLSFDKGRTFVSAHEIDKLIEMAHSDHLCETPGGDARRCPFIKITVELSNELE